MAIRASEATRGLLVALALLAAGCGDDDGPDGPRPTPTATRNLGATEPPTRTPTPLISQTPTLCPFTVTPGASPTASGSPTATYTALVCPTNAETPTPAGPCTSTPTATSTGTHPPFTPTATPGLATLGLFDANPRYTSNVFLPLADYTADTVRPLTTDAWIDAARTSSRAAADGATLLLVALKLNNAADADPVELAIAAGPDVPTGGLFAVDDQRLIDRTAEGGTIDQLPDGPTTLEVDTVLVDGARWAFALYRAPRDYDGVTPRMDRSRTIELSASQDGTPLNAERFAVVRPLVVFVHGTTGDTSNWDPFALWRDSANEIGNFQGGVLPFYATRISYQWIALAAGPMAANGATILPQLSRALEGWKVAIDAAATQADVVTHSFGGPTTRQAAQTQEDPNPLTPADQLNFRAATNWGHGLIRKLVTLAATHRGSALANHVSLLNRIGNGGLRADLCLDGIDLAGGALADQLVISPALQSLHETRVAGHAVIGSGTVQFADAPSISACFTAGLCEVCYSAAGYHGEYSVYRFQDQQNGPYKGAGDLGGTICGLSLYCEDFNYDSYTRMANYFFNLSYGPPFPDPDCDLPIDGPNYDLTVSACSSRGQQPEGAYSTHADIDPSLRGRLSHTQLITTPAVSDRVRFLLHQPTTGEHFSPFAATGGPTCLEEQLAEIGSAADFATGSPCSAGPDSSLANSCYNSCNSCEADADTPPCFVECKVVPAPLVLRETSQPAPVFVYGRVSRGALDGQWTNVQSLANQIWCTVGMSVSDASVARITTWKDISGAPDQSGINVIEGVRDGRATLTLTVQNNMDGPITVPVQVDTTPPATDG